MLQINELHAGVENKDILKGVNLEHKSRRGSCYYGPQWFWEKHIVFCDRWE